MVNYEVKGVNVVSLLKSFPIVFAVFGAVIGIVIFFFFPSSIDSANSLGFGMRFFAWLIYIVFYTAVMSVVMVVFAWLYNYIIGKMGKGVVISLEQTEE